MYKIMRSSNWCQKQVQMEFRCCSFKQSDPYFSLGDNLKTVQVKSTVIIINRSSVPYRGGFSLWTDNWRLRYRGFRDLPQIPVKISIQLWIISLQKQTIKCDANFLVQLPPLKINKIDWHYWGCKNIWTEKHKKRNENVLILHRKAIKTSRHIIFFRI